MYKICLPLRLTVLPPMPNSSNFKGNFVTQKTTHKLSTLAYDQDHEQLNAMVKGDGGVIGITDNETALRRWMVAGPETVRLSTEYDDFKASKEKEGTRTPP